MKKIIVRNADGSRKMLALVRQAGDTVYACPISRYREAAEGREDAVVGFPAADVSLGQPEDAAA
jgi:hypothetical protein